MTTGVSTIGRLAATTAAIVSILACAGVIAYANDWPQFRGPTGQGHAPDAAVPLEWSETRNVTWKSPVEGRGWSSPVIADGRVWLTTALTDSDEGSSLRLLAYDVETGTNTVDVEVFGGNETYLLNPKNSFASPTPVLDPGRRAGLRPLRGDGHGGGQHERRRRLAHAVSVHLAARERRIADSA